MFIVNNAFAESNSVGVKQISTSQILAWNQNAVNETYYNLTTGLLQYANRPDRMNDLTYVYGGAKNQSGTMFYFLRSSLGGLLKANTDNNSYYWLSNEINISADGTNALFKKNDSRGVNDSYVNMTLTLVMPSNKIGSFFYVTGFFNIDILRDGIYDPFTLVQKNGTQVRWDNSSGNRILENVTRIVIDGNTAEYGYDIRFPNQVTVLYNHSSKSTNGDLLFLESIGNIVKDKEYKFYYLWIDACVTTCDPPLICMYTFSNISAYSYNSVQGKLFAGVNCQGGIDIACIGCVWVGCAMEWRQNTTTEPTVITTTDRDRPFKCGSTSCVQASTHNANKNLITSSIGETTFYCANAYSSTDWILSNLTGNQYYFIVGNKTPIISIWKPTNNSVLNSTKNWEVFGVNNTGLQADNWSIYFNNTINYTSTTVNFTLNRTFDTFACYLYKAIGCYSHNCGINNEGLLSLCQVTSDTTKPNITFISQIPNDLNVTNLIGNHVNITYNISDASGLINSTILLYYKTNNSLNDISQYVNGSALSGYFVEDYNSLNDSSYKWELDDNDILPATYPLNEEVLENTVHQGNSLVNANSLISIEVLNVTRANYSFFEYSINRTLGSGVLNIFYCNSSYSFTSSILTDVNCVLFDTKNSNAFDHCHENYACHQYSPLSIDVNGRLSGIRVTNVSYFILRGSSSTTWKFYSITNFTRTNAFRTSNNIGNNWNSQTYTVDAHLHQFNGNDTFYYYACATDAFANNNCSSVRGDLLQFASLHPIPPIVYSPVYANWVYTRPIYINYTSAISPNSYVITKYNISLLNPDLTFNMTIIGNNSPNLHYDWNTTLLYAGEHIIQVEACDNLNQCDTGYSDTFFIVDTASEGTAPPTRWIEYKKNDSYEWIENWYVYAIAVFIIIIGLTVTIINKKKDEGKENIKNYSTDD
jgi:hypothetical protein